MGACEDERAGVNVGRTAAENFQRGESDARARLHVPHRPFPEKALDIHYV